MTLGRELAAAGSMSMRVGLVAYNVGHRVFIRREIGRLQAETGVLDHEGIGVYSSATGTSWEDARAWARMHLVTHTGGRL